MVTCQSIIRLSLNMPDFWFDAFEGLVSDSRADPIHGDPLRAPVADKGGLLDGTGLTCVKSFVYRILSKKVTLRHLENLWSLYNMNVFKVTN